MKVRRSNPSMYQFLPLRERFQQKTLIYTKILYKLTLVMIIIIVKTPMNNSTMTRAPSHTNEYKDIIFFNVYMQRHHQLFCQTNLYFVWVICVGEFNLLQCNSLNCNSHKWKVLSANIYLIRTIYTLQHLNKCFQVLFVGLSYSSLLFYSFVLIFKVQYLSSQE